MVNAYVLVIAGLMLTCGALGDRWGRKRLLLIGLGVFGISSAVAAGVDAAGPVIIARGLMGMGAAIMMPGAFATLAALFGPTERGKGLDTAVHATSRPAQRIPRSSARTRYGLGPEGLAGSAGRGLQHLSRSLDPRPARGSPEQGAEEVGLVDDTRHVGALRPGGGHADLRTGVVGADVAG